MFLSLAPRVGRMSWVDTLDVPSMMVNSLNTAKPTELLQNSLGAQVLVELKGRRKIRGKLRGYDQHLNLIIEAADEISFNEETEEEEITQIETVIVRGDNVVIVSPPPE